MGVMPDQRLQPASGTKVVPTLNSVQTELLIRRPRVGERSTPKGWLTSD
jgi:hypothetical protein